MSSPDSGGEIGTFPISGNGIIDPLVWLGYKWGTGGAGTGATISYSFPKSGATWAANYSFDNEPGNVFQPFSAAQQNAAKQAMALWAEVADIHVVQTPDLPNDVGDIRFGNSGAVTQDPTAAAWAYTPDGSGNFPSNGDVWFDNKFKPNLQLQPGQEGFATMLHEIGHALGLDHPFLDSDKDHPDPNEAVLAVNLDTDQYTVMSYTPELSTLAWASTPQILDILAIQYIYGANMTTRAGNDTYKFSASTEVNRAIWDAGGIDTLDFSNQTRSVIGFLLEGEHIRFGGHPGTTSLLGIAYGVTIENAIGGSGADTIDGNQAANTLSGGAGNDTLNGWNGFDTLLGGAGSDVLRGGDVDFSGDYLDGGAGADKMYGGSGSDTYVIDNIKDFIDEEGYGPDSDTVRSTITVNLAALAAGSIENAALLGSAAINATGNAGGNELTGNAGANKLDGKEGADTMSGNKGADTYYVDSVGDQVIETTAGAAGGIDSVISSVNFTLGANVEKLTLTGSDNTDGFGTSGNNTLIGNSGANNLDGGVGNDTMTGGGGDDTYWVDAAGDVVNETVLNSKGGGLDTVMSTVTFSLATRANIENLTLYNAGKNATGNALANIITGSSIDNVLDGGANADTLKGGFGNDTYIFDNLGDTAFEDNIFGLDTVKTSALIVGAFAEVENYTYTSTKAWTFTGNELNNTIQGGAGKDSLDGGDGNDTLLGNGGNDTLTGGKGDDLLDGGIGNDKMNGGEGKDTYIVNAAGDTVGDDGGDTDDLVKSSVTINLLSGGFLGIENVVLTGAVAINATGNNSDNQLTGNAAANVLDGKGGADTMTGGNGADTYFVDVDGDQVIEVTGGAAGGIDLVKAGLTYSLAALGNVENLTLLEGGDFDATGNGLKNILIGNSGANRLDGGGGADTMTGGLGDDTYVVNLAGDVVNETSKNGGFDTVESTVTFSLATRANIEDLELKGSGTINGTGNALDNHITGNDGKNTLDGGGGNDNLDGGAENDILIGGTGNDFLHGGDGIDKLTGGGGKDTFDFNLLSELGDTITDFSKSADKLDISDLLDSVTYGGSDVFADGYVSFAYNGSTTNVLFDQDGTLGGSAATALANLLNVHLTSADSGNFIV